MRAKTKSKRKRCSCGRKMKPVGRRGQPVEAHHAISWVCPDCPLQKPCRHCKDGKRSRPRGLCWACYYNPAVRALYRAEPHRNTPRAYLPDEPEWDFNHEAPLPDRPTRAYPGTQGKIDEMARRAALRQQLHHPDDAWRP